MRVIKRLQSLISRKIALFLAVAVLLISNLSWKAASEWSNETALSKLLSAFGEELPDHARPNATKEVIQRGYDLIHYGKTTGPDGKTSSYISKFYVCTTCHNQQQEDPDLSIFNPETRLDYVEKKGMKFLQGSTFYGIANRETWYNGDYYLKYGDLVKPANKSLAEATQLCAKVCSSGRYLEDWELEAILAYYWNNQIKLGDLELNKEEMNRIIAAKPGQKPELVALLKSKYATSSPATFGELPEDKSKGYGYEGKPEIGKKIYQLSCQSCHSFEGTAGMALDNSKPTFKKFKRNLDKSGYYNIYEISRHGTYAGKGKPRYMPLYPKERLSDKQLEDLRAFILQQAN